MKRSDKYLSALQSLLPNGRLFNRVMGSALTKLLHGFSIECERVDIAAGQYIDEMIPSSTTLGTQNGFDIGFDNGFNETPFRSGLLVEWERAVSIPDECIPIANTEAERKANVLFRLSDTGGSSIAYWENRAEVAGFAGTVVTEPVHHAFRVGTGAMGDTLGDLSKIRSTPFRVGVSKMGDTLDLNNTATIYNWTVTFPAGSVDTESVRCDFERNKPAHTQITFIIAA